MSPLDDSRARPRRAATADSTSARSDESTNRPELVELVLGRPRNTEIVAPFKTHPLIRIKNISATRVERAFGILIEMEYNRIVCRLNIKSSLE